MELAVREICQGASGGSSVVRYRAEFRITDSAEVHVSVASVFPDDASPADVNQAVTAIREGFSQILAPRSEGAEVKVHDLTIHPVDFKAYKYQEATAHFLGNYLDTDR